MNSLVKTSIEVVTAPVCCSAKDFLVEQAMVFAWEVHRNQRRKYTGELYWSHLSQVAGTVAPYANRLGVEAIAVAWLHDTREDQNIHPEILSERFGYDVAMGVDILTDVPFNDEFRLPRARRKAQKLAQLVDSPAWVQAVAIGDALSNVPSIIKWDPNFAPLYCFEKQALCDALIKAPESLRLMLQDVLTEYASREPQKE